MDPFTQGIVGNAAAQLVSQRSHKVMAGCFGFLSGLAADLDVLIRSSTDPLLALEYHRQFTHSLVFIPIGALFCAIILWGLFRKKIGFKSVYLYCFAGYATHAVLDACTTYGTQLLWPFSDARIAWNNVSVVDPLFTLPLLILVVVTMVKSSRIWALSAAAFAFSYLSLGVLQNHRAEALAEQLAQSRGHTPVNLGVKPSFANIIVWKSVYEYQGRYYVDAIRVGLSNRLFKGSSTEKLDLSRQFSWLDMNSQQAKDVERFAWFSNQYLALDPHNPDRIIDIRYSLIPNRMDGMWGIVLDSSAGPTDHVAWTTTRPRSSDLGQHTAILWEMIKN